MRVAPPVEKVLHPLRVLLGVLTLRPVLIHLLQGEYLLGFALYLPRVLLAEQLVAR